MQPTSAIGPINYDLEAPEKVANWRPLVQWLLAIPHHIVLYGLNIAMNAIWVISFFTVLFTKQIPEGLFRFQVMVMRYQHRVYSYVFFMREPYPPFDFTMSELDPGGDPVRVTVERPETLNRWLPLVKWFLAIPHYIVLTIFAIGAFFVLIAAFFVVLFTGRFPTGMRDYVVKVQRYAVRLQAYLYLLRDEYPTFALV